jgi:hypothetical protein
MTTPAAHAMRLHLGELRQLVDWLDPASFRKRERDLDPKAAEVEPNWARLAGRQPDPASDQACQDGLLQQRWGMSSADCYCFEQVLRAFGELKLALALVRGGIARARIRAAPAPTDRSPLRSAGSMHWHLSLRATVLRSRQFEPPAGFVDCLHCAWATHAKISIGSSVPSSSRTGIACSMSARAAWRLTSAAPRGRLACFAFE